MSLYRVGQIDQTAVPNPPAGKYYLFLDTNGNWLKRDSAGNVTTSYNTSALDGRITVLEGAAASDDMHSGINEIEALDSIVVSAKKEMAVSYLNVQGILTVNGILTILN